MDQPWREGAKEVNFRSFEDLARIVRANFHRIPADIDIVVGIPRSGMIPATMIALYFNVALTDLEGLLEGRVISAGSQRAKGRVKTEPHQWKKVLLVDDSIQSGNSMKAAVDRLREQGRWDVVSCAVLGVQEAEGKADLIFEICPAPRIFEWNMMHHPLLTSVCIDIDGVLCVDPTDEENDDGLRYQEFLTSAQPLHLPTYPVGAVVSSRLEKYRAETEAWLARHNVKYETLHLLDMTAEERRRKRAHGTFKADVYRSNPNWRLFIESDPSQAEEIARLTGKAVVCINSMDASKETRRGEIERRLKRRLKRIAARFSGGA